MAAPDETVKVVLLGESGVGKSSLALRFVTNEFRPYSEATIGASFMSKTVEWEENLFEEGETNDTTTKKRIVSFKIWDTAGEEKYHSLAPMYYRGAGAAILVFDMCNLATFDTMQHWVDELKSSGPPGIVLAVCANKSDLAMHRQVPTEAAKDYAEKVGALYMETSARDHTNVDELFREVAKRVPSAKGSDSAAQAEEGSVALDLRYHEARNGRSCC